MLRAAPIRLRISRWLGKEGLAERVRRLVETGLYRFLEADQPQILEELGKTKALTDDLNKALESAIDDYKAQFLA